jgi:predicted acetyltransferase
MFCVSTTAPTSTGPDERLCAKMRHVQIEDHAYRHPELPRLLEQQVLDFWRLVWAEDSMGEHRFRQRMHDVGDDSIHFVRSAGSLLVAHVQVIPIDLDGRDRRLLIGGISAVLTYPQFRGEGHASALLRQAAEHMETAGLDLGMLFCDEENVSFYSRLGWHPLDRGRVTVREDPDSEDRHMVLGDAAALPDKVELDFSW